MKRKERKEGDSQSWLNTYADMITLVLTFFVLLYSISNVNILKLEKVAEAMQKKLGIETKVSLEDVPKDIKFPELADGKTKPTSNDTPMDEVKSSIENYIQSENMDATVTEGDNILYLRFKNEMLFGPDSADLLDTSKDFLNYLGDVLKTKDSEILAVYINGHTADAPNSAWNDRILSSSRANNVAIYLEEQKGIDPKKLISRGYGKNYPIADNSTKEGRDQNRRVDIIIVGNGYEWSQVDGNGSGNAETIDPLSPIQVPDAAGK